MGAVNILVVDRGQGEGRGNRQSTEDFWGRKNTQHDDGEYVSLRVWPNSPDVQRPEQSLM